MHGMRITGITLAVVAFIVVVLGGCSLGTSRLADQVQTRNDQIMVFPDECTYIGGLEAARVRGTYSAEGEVDVFITDFNNRSQSLLLEIIGQEICSGKAGSFDQEVKYKTPVYVVFGRASDVTRLSYALEFIDESMASACMWTGIISLAIAVILLVVSILLIKKGVEIPADEVERTREDTVSSIMPVVALHSSDPTGQPPPGSPMISETTMAAAGVQMGDEPGN